MKLYFSPYACSLAPHIILCETGTPYSLEKVELRTHLTGKGDDYFTISPRGQVPLLVLADGEQLTEGPVIAQYLAELAGATDLLPAKGMQRYRVLEWQNYISTELHKSFSPLFNPAFSTEAKQIVRTQLRKKYDWLNTRIADSSFLTGEQFTIADAYLFTVTSWAKLVELELTDLSAVQAYLTRVAQRPSVKEAMKKEAEFS